MIEPEITAAVLAVVGLLLLLAGVASLLPARLGIPALVSFLLIGMAAGSEGIGRIPFEDYALSFRLGCIALVLILFDGGLNTSLFVLRRVALQAALLATLGVALTALVVAGFGVLFGLAVPIALLVGAVVSSTDAAAVFAVLRSSNVRLKERTGAILEAESGLNDPLAMFLTVVATELTLGRFGGAREIGLFCATQLGVGVAAGIAFGWLGRRLLRTVRLPVAGLYPVLTVAIAFVSFGVPTLLGGSGFLAVYLCAIGLAAGPLPYRAGVRRVHDALAWLLQIMMFLLLGLLVFPSRLMPAMPVGIGLALVLAFVARPLATLTILAPFRLPWNERLFISWIGLRGAVPIVLATYPVLRGVPGAGEVFHLVFFIVLVNSFLPGATVSWFARVLGLARDVAPSPAATVEVVSLRDFPGDFGWYRVSPASAVANSYVRDLSLPEGCLVSLVVRGDEILTPKGSTLLEPGDQLCIFVTPESSPFLQLLFGDVGEDAV